MNKMNIALTVILLAILSIYAMEGVTAHKLKVDCQSNSLDTCVLYAIPLQGVGK